MENNRWGAGLVAGIGYMFAHWWLALTLLPDWSKHPFYTEEILRDVWQVDTANVKEKILVAGAGLMGGIAVSHLVRGNGRAGWLLLLVLLSLVGRELWDVPTEWFGLPIFAYGALTLLRCPIAGRPTLDQLVGGGLAIASILLGVGAALGEWLAWPVAIVAAALGAMVLRADGGGSLLVKLVALGAGITLTGGLAGHLFAADANGGLVVGGIIAGAILTKNGALMLILAVPNYAWWLLTGVLDGQNILSRLRVRGAMLDE